MQFLLLLVYAGLVDFKRNLLEEQCTWIQQFSVTTYPKYKNAAHLKVSVSAWVYALMVYILELDQYKASACVCVCVEPRLGMLIALLMNTDLPHTRISSFSSSSTYLALLLEIAAERTILRSVMIIFC